jgi:hypothetical protein
MKPWGYCILIEKMNIHIGMDNGKLFMLSGPWYQYSAKNGLKHKRKKARRAANQSAALLAFYFNQSI